MAGDMATANNLLGYRYGVEGVVVEVRTLIADWKIGKRNAQALNFVLHGVAPSEGLQHGPRA